MYELGQALRICHAGQDRVGELVGIHAGAHGCFYDVSLEDVVVKAVPQDQVRSVSTSDLQALLTALLAPSPVPLKERQALLRQSYVTFLAQALDRASAGQEATGAVARFAVGDDLALVRQDRWSLARVCAAQVAAQGLRYVVDAEGERLQVAQDELVPLADVPSLDGGLALGCRVRFLAQGHEADPAFEGTLCAAQHGARGWTFSLAFDDGDVLEDLTASDVCAIGKTSHWPQDGTCHLR